MIRRGFFISLEGAEGVGKSTNLEFIRTILEDNGQKVVVTREPGGTPLAEDIRQLLLTNRDETVDVHTETLLMFAARAQHARTVIEPLVQRGDTVLCDRFTHSTYAYQGGGRGVLIKELEFLAQFAHSNLWPDLTIYLDAPVDRAFARIRDREQDRIEQSGREFFERVRYKYLEMAENDSRISVVDANQELSTVQDDLRSLLSSFLSEQK
tara:strand:+ start:441 stop:1070 length:630 start_codon:yes stop_codon:yes gene_type:complete